MEVASAHRYIIDHHVDNQHRGINASDGSGVDLKEVESAFKANGDEEGLLACASGCGSEGCDQLLVQARSKCRCGSAAGCGLEWAGHKPYLC
jgi:hypothetical protein